MNKPDIIPPQEDFELPETIQEQIRQQQNLTPEQRAALVGAQRKRPAGEDTVPFEVRERERLLRGLQEIARRREKTHGTGL